MRAAGLVLAALLIAGPAAAQSLDSGMRLTYAGGHGFGDFELDVRPDAGGYTFVQTLLANSKPGEQSRGVLRTRTIRSDQCPKALEALERLPDLKLPGMRILPRVNADGSVNIPPVGNDMSSFSIEAPTDGVQGGGRVRLSGAVIDPVGVWFTWMMRAIEPCWDNPAAASGQ